MAFLNNFIQRLMLKIRSMPTSVRILLILVAVVAFSVFASSGFGRNPASAPTLFTDAKTTVETSPNGPTLTTESGNNSKSGELNTATSSMRAVQAGREEASLVSVKPVKPTVFHGDARRLPLVKPKLKKVKPEPKEPGAELPQTAPADAALQPFAPAAPAPTPANSFPGLDFANWGDGWPPDTNGDVGPNHYIQTVNTSIGIWDKATGIRVAAFTFDTFFSQAATGTPCDNSNQGDPVVLYDALSDRWIISDFAWSNYTSGAMYQCMAVSQTSDPVAGGWYFYAWQTASGGKIPDYPKLGVWPDGIYMSANVFNTTGSQAFQNAQVWAFNRAEMESGVTAHAVSFNLPSKISGNSIFSLLPSNVRNNGSAPPTGTPNYFTSIWGTFSARVWKFHVDYSVPANSTLTGPSNVSIAAFSSGPGNAPENGGNALDTLTHRVMMQNQYQNLGGAESLWLTHTVGSGGSPNIAQLRWYQLNVTSGTVVTAGPVQQGTWAPDTKYRFMPSLAVDKNGDMALGYSVSSSTMYPSIRYAGRLVNDPLNTLGQGETSLIEGSGFQCCLFSDGTVNNRWGDYSAMTTDTDGCTFWYTNEYYDTLPVTLAQDNWKTRIGSFKYSQCTPNAMGTLQGTVTDASNGNPISGALVVAGIYRLKTDASGFYQFSNTPTGTYNLNVSASGYSNGSANNVTVTNGATTIQNFALTPPAVNTSLAVNPAAGTYGGTTTLTATLTQQDGAAVNGRTITFSLNGSGFVNNTAVTNASGVATLSGVSLSGINAGTYPTGVGASFAGDASFNSSSGSNSLVVSKATPVISWSDPAPITQGTPLSSTQLNATSTVAGTFAYNPPSGTVLPVGNAQPLDTLFTPTDTGNYNNNSATVHIDVMSNAPPNDTIWVEDTTPAGATLAGYGGDSWNWIGSNPTPFSGSLANQSELVAGAHEHYFFGATETLTVNTGDTLIAYVYLDPVNTPTEVLLEWTDGTWEHRAYWGANNLPWGVDGTNSRRFIGPLPATGQWVRLEVPASLVGLEGHTLHGMAFALYGGRATWDYAGKAAP
jgi:hypothetical protein